MGGRAGIGRWVQFWAVMGAFLVFAAALLLQDFDPVAWWSTRMAYADANGSTLAGYLGSGWQRTDAITNSYLKAFGRYPTKEEMAYWSSVNSMDSRVQSLDSLIANHRQWLKGNLSERTQTVNRAFEAVFGHWIYPGQQDLFESYRQDVAQNGTIYTELKERLAGAFVDTAYTQLLKRSPDASGRRDWVLKIAYGGWSTEQVWTAIAQSEERVNQFGYWAPARTAYDGQREICFGAIGPKCDGAPRSNPVWKDKFMRPDGTEMGYIEIQVSVGSILHDNACLRATGGGTMCNGLPKGLTLDSLPLATYVQPASLEWNKAAWNTYDGRFWTARFGPYPTGSTERAYWTDDLSKTTNRASKMAPVVAGGLQTVGLGAWPAPTIAYTLGETRQSRALKAPVGTYVDRGDQEFCATQQYTEEGNPWIAKWWGKCK
jgi:hypothetical protein